VEGIDIMQISGHKNVAFINNYSTRRSSFQSSGLYIGFNGKLEFIFIRIK
jgi:hypothetical protein